MNARLMIVSVYCTITFKYKTGEENFAKIIFPWHVIAGIIFLIGKKEVEIKMRMKASCFVVTALWIIFLGSMLPVISAAVTTNFTFALQKGDYAIWKRTLNQTTSSVGPPFTSITTTYEKRVVKGNDVISSGNECDFTVDVYENNTANPIMTDQSHWTLNRTEHSILNKTVEGIMNATPIYPMDVGLDEIYSNELVEVLVKTMAAIPFLQNSSSMTVYVLKNDTSNSTCATATSGSLNFTYDLSYKFNMSMAPTMFYVSNMTMFMEENATINENHLVDHDSMFMNMTTLMYMESNPGNPLSNMTMVMDGMYDLQYTHIQTGGGLDPMITAIVVVSCIAGIVIVAVAVAVKQRRRTRI